MSSEAAIIDALIHLGLNIVNFKSIGAITDEIQRMTGDQTVTYEQIVEAQKKLPNALGATTRQNIARSTGAPLDKTRADRDGHPELKGQAMTTDAPGSTLLGPMIVRLRKLKDHKDEVNAVLKDINAEEVELESAIMAGLRESGQDKATVKGIGTASISKKYRAGAEPEAWNDIYKWCVDTGNTHILHRALTAAKVGELIDNGVQMPKGLRMDPYEDLSFRRA